MSALYFINGDRVSVTEAKRFISAEAESHGYSPEDWEHSWVRRERSEAAREFLGEITGYRLNSAAPAGRPLE